nr:hypothetical protein [Tanacetum cinerariifolium]
MNVAYYPDVRLEQLVPDQFWIDEECKYDIAVIAVRTHMRILSVVRIEVFSMYGYDYMKKIVLRRADLKEHVIVERDFKYLYPSNFEDLLEHLNAPPQIVRVRAAYDDSYGLLQHPEVSLVQSSSNEPFQASHNPPCLEHLVNGLDHGRCSVLITFSLDCLWQILHPNPFQMIIKSIANNVERPVAEFMKFNDPHQPVFLVLVLVDESSWV